jgi:hypothetical protein
MYVSMFDYACSSLKVQCSHAVSSSSVVLMWCPSNVFSEAVLSRVGSICSVAHLSFCPNHLQEGVWLPSALVMASHHGMHGYTVGSILCKAFTADDE